MPVLYIANKNYSSWSLRPWFALTVASYPFEERLVRFVAGGSRQTFRAFSPTGTVPCLVDGDTVIWDSLAIVEYAAETQPHIWPADRDARAWARSAAAEMHSGFSALRARCSMTIGLRIRPHGIDEALARDIARVDALWSEGPARFGGPYLAGPEPTAVDAFFAPVVFRVQTYGLKLSEPASAYQRHMLAHPAMRAWEADALAEDFRDPDHERENATLGVVTQDLRTGADP